MSRIPATSNLHDIRQSFKELWDVVRVLEVGNINMKRRRVINASDAVQPADYITKQQVEALLRGLQIPRSSSGIVSVSGNIKAFFFCIDKAVSVDSTATCKAIAPENVWPIWVQAALHVAPVGADMTIQMKKAADASSAGSNYGSAITISDGNLASSVLTGSTFGAITKLNALWPDVTQVGSSTAGSQLTVVIVCEIK